MGIMPSLPREEEREIFRASFLCFKGGDWGENKKNCFLLCFLIENLNNIA